MGNPAETAKRIWWLGKHLKKREKNIEVRGSLVARDKWKKMAHTRLCQVRWELTSVKGGKKVRPRGEESFGKGRPEAKEKGGGPRAEKPLQT